MKTEPVTPTLKMKVGPETLNALADMSVPEAAIQKTPNMDYAILGDESPAPKAKSGRFEALAKSKPVISDAEVDTAEGYSSDENSTVTAAELASVPRRHHAKYRQYHEERKRLATGIKDMTEKMKNIDSILAHMQKS